MGFHDQRKEQEWHPYRWRIAKEIVRFCREAARELLRQILPDRQWFGFQAVIPPFLWRVPRKAKPLWVKAIRLIDSVRDQCRSRHSVFSDLRQVLRRFC